MRLQPNKATPRESLWSMRDRHPEQIDLTGTWRSHDYQCPWGVRHTELIEVVHEDGQIVARKVTGDDCVPAGFETFSGRLPHGGVLGAITWTVGQAHAPASETRSGFLKVISHDEFHAGSEFDELIFRRALPR